MSNSTTHKRQLRKVYRWTQREIEKEHNERAALLAWEQECYKTREIGILDTFIPVYLRKQILTCYFSCDNCKTIIFLDRHKAYFYWYRAFNPCIYCSDIIIHKQAMRLNVVH